MGRNCPKKENCIRYEYRNWKGDGVWFVDEKKECEYGKDDFLYAKKQKDK